mgnify:CR=1 FL=1
MGAAHDAPAIVAPRASAQHATVTLFIVPILTPFPDVAAHVITPGGACVVRRAARADVTFGLWRDGLDPTFVRAVQGAYPDSGFHRRLRNPSYACQKLLDVGKTG